MCHHARIVIVCYGEPHAYIAITCVLFCGYLSHRSPGWPSDCSQHLGHLAVDEYQINVGPWKVHSVKDLMLSCGNPANSDQAFLWMGSSREKLSPHLQMLRMLGAMGARDGEGRVEADRTQFPIPIITISIIG